MNKICLSGQMELRPVSARNSCESVLWFSMFISLDIVFKLNLSAPGYDTSAIIFILIFIYIYFCCLFQASFDIVGRVQILCIRGFWLYSLTVSCCVGKVH